MALTQHDCASLVELSDLTGKTAVVTGGARGIGGAICSRLAEAGAHVVIADIDAELAETTAQTLNGEGRKATAHQLDVVDAAAVESLAEMVRSTYGTLDIWINNAGIYPITPVLEITDDEWNVVLDVNLSGTFYGSRAAGRLMRHQGGGTIVNIASTASFRAESSAHYVASKHAVLGLTKSLASELAGDGVRVLAVAPGPTSTEGARAALEKVQILLTMFPSPAVLGPSNRMATADDVARVVYFAVTNLAGFVTGSVIPVEGGALAG